MDGFYKDRAREFREIERILKGVANPIRLAIIDTLRSGQPMTVKEICDKLGLRQAVASSYLRKMHQLNIVGCQRKGRCVFYFIKNERIIDIIDCLNRCSRR